ncbi:MAG: hypothetical protein OXJ52_03740, partial [Oligoflexia bacterium]|nr:hypothetical protein [Oligoflexia bacterium]
FKHLKRQQELKSESLSEEAMSLSGLKLGITLKDFIQPLNIKALGILKKGLILTILPLNLNPLF